MVEPKFILKPLSPIAVNAALLSVVLGILFVLLLGCLHLLEPEFDPMWRFISEYALGDFGWMMHLAFGVLAMCLISTCVAIFSQIRTIVGFIGLVILGISAVGMFFAAIFVTDPMTASPDEATFNGKMHVLGATLDYTPVAALLLSFALVRNQAWRPIRKRLFITAGITLIAMAAFMFQIPHDGQFGPDILAGLFGRLLILSYFGWLFTVGIHALKLSKQAVSS
ncbi:DUF998 domain-containing protein [Cohnella herbarum]|uniref:DUF998 domain-containing protein n=1 Tax=Cohnella herbarum TaxID=2728023 RepID=A0A7Z2VGZ7_9BACL|nr:DUF998 domain-containing protein [Cohnella herbarum]QJD83008.1 DUF998 domain-containing protein [Cohnella herbarum]